MVKLSFNFNPRKNLNIGRYIVFVCIVIMLITGCGKTSESSGLVEFLLPTVASDTVEILPVEPPVVLEIDSSDENQTLSQATITPTVFIESPLTIGSTMISEVDGMELVYIPAGNFSMGSNQGDSNEQPVHEVYLDAYWMDQFEVTNDQYKLCVADRACTAPADLAYYNNSTFNHHPVVNINWFQAKTYCQWAGRDLPTEAQWEKAARGEDGRIYPWGDSNPTRDHVNLCDLGCASGSKTENFNDGYAKTAPVGSFPKGSSSYGVHDMAGNVWEWVNDWFEKNYYSSQREWENPSGPTIGKQRVLRGGAWDNSELFIRSTNRGWGSPAVFGEDLGIRCVLSIDRP